MKHLLFLLLICPFCIEGSRAQSLPERLGYPKDTKLLIIHADDLGVSHAENAASIAAFERGLVNSGSIMVPCPWFPEIAAYARAHPEADLGLHLTLTSEWKQYKWGPVVAGEQTAGLVDAQGYFFDNTTSVATKASPDEVEREIRAQIERAKQFGVDPTHFDAHMAGMFVRPEFFKLYLDLSHEYRVPVLIVKEIFTRLNINQNNYVTDQDVVLDQLFMAEPADYAAGMEAYYTRVLKEVQPGLSCLLIHVAYDNAEMQAVTVDHPDYGAAWRQADFDFFTGAKCRQLLKEQNIRLITWREIRDKLYR
ncbi:hypothetical protein SAMN05421823_104146 [Catalinimonas alkaloidigena]|uniref:YdjC-like protein n=1 Tax=Catalinimonas alkaloidigena TaxID=1075417 RepID=A0A1G9GL37_9BACT|nr:polysaccharide deacetylase family protein [Catalinimonas alkaloidigena]SDL01367.1 hypothetical protein SAMN05421823_104146 [Catalinimonas alkaloidigena]